tara:strand:+ start:288 stop:479 length:192 start_codon:yes stop_codon:yes gene_type:complete
VLDYGYYINTTPKHANHTAKTNPTDTAAGSFRIIGVDAYLFIVSAMAMLRRRAGELSSGGGDL